MEKASLNRRCFGLLQTRFFYPLLEGAGLPVNFLPGGSGNFPGPLPGADRFALRPPASGGLRPLALPPFRQSRGPRAAAPGSSPAPILTERQTPSAESALAVCILAAGLGKEPLFGVLSLCRFPLPRLALLGGEAARRENPQFTPFPDSSFRFLPRCRPSCPAFTPAAGSAGFPGERRSHRTLARRRGAGGASVPMAPASGVQIRMRGSFRSASGMLCPRKDARASG